MNLEGLIPWIVAGAVLAFFLWRVRRLHAVKRLLPELMSRGAVIVDVRTAAEFAAGARPGSRNIPLNELAARAGELDPKKPVILCCASGARSGMAATLLKARGFAEVVNAGPWTNTL